ncbi:MAG TPA: heme lyase CcmF/NrfE family subunit [Rhodanobacteraceae bacterium]|jgi:cytochrome c-type biogenesis protein CcmF|nr:heme lyase CcmF/NrfE family subunit [Rhodanobacteraceae bacterium]
MTPELGQLALILALILSALQCVLPIVGAWRGSRPLMATGRSLAVGQFVFVALAFGVLAWAFWINDFSVAYVAQNSNLTLPWYYRLAAVWGAHEGSLLLWMLILNLWTVALVALGGKLPEAFFARVIGVLGFVAFGFLLYMVATSNPFVRILPAPPNGADLNPVLQDPGLTFHPPLLYMGYVGFSVAFAFAIASLLGGELKATWVRWARPWTNVAWGFLTVGIVAGSAWAYYELGWGGWWFWDPVENASFMPWLIGAALIHAQAITDKRGGLRAWTLLLSIFGFAFSLLGTFLVRSGLLTSVHAFAFAPTRGLFILVYLGVVIGGSLLLYALRAPKVTGGQSFALASRETMMVIGNLMLTVACAMVMLGTLYPLVGEALGIGRISVGPPYFGPMFLLLMTPLVLALPFGPLSRWGKADLKVWTRALLKIVALAVAAGIIGFIAGARTFYQLLGITAAVWVMAGVALFAIKRWREAPAGKRYPFEMVGMMLAHFGIGVFIAGAILTRSMSVEQDVSMRPGSSVDVGAYDFRFHGVTETQGPNWTAQQGTVSITRDGKPVVVLHPQKRTYAGGQVQTEAAIQAGIFRDLYVSLGDRIGPNGEWSLRVYDKPFVRWIWGGGILMMLGSFVVVLDRRFRLQRAVEPEAARAEPDPVPPAKLADEQA